MHQSRYCYGLVRMCSIVLTFELSAETGGHACEDSSDCRMCSMVLKFEI